MRRKHLILALLTILFTNLTADAQEKTATEKQPPSKATAEERSPVPVTVTVVFTEFDGDKKIGSLPYTMPINAGIRTQPGYNKLRMGVRVPIVATSTKEGAPVQVQYLDVGTNIDCRARNLEDGQFEVELSVERSSIYSTGAEGTQKEWSPGDQMMIAQQPIVRQYRSTMTLLMRDGQIIQRSLATDPVSGRVLKVDVTLNVVK